jgi:hypothetical protein
VDSISIAGDFREFANILIRKNFDAGGFHADFKFQEKLPFPCGS